MDLLQLRPAHVQREWGVALVAVGDAQHERLGLGVVVHKVALLPLEVLLALGVVQRVLVVLERAPDALAQRRHEGKDAHHGGLLHVLAVGLLVVGPAEQMAGHQHALLERQQHRALLALRLPVARLHVPHVLVLQPVAERAPLPVEPGELHAARDGPGRVDEVLEECHDRARVLRDGARLWIGSAIWGRVCTSNNGHAIVFLYTGRK